MAKSTPLLSCSLSRFMRQVGSGWPSITAMALAGLALLGKKVYETVMGTERPQSITEDAKEGVQAATGDGLLSVAPPDVMQPTAPSAQAPEVNGTDQPPAPEAQADTSTPALPLIAQPQKRKQDWGTTELSTSDGVKKEEVESGGEEEEGLEDLREQGRRKRASVVRFEDEPALNEDEEDEEDEEEEAQMRLAEQELALRLKGMVKCRLGLGRQRLVFDAPPTTFPTYDVVRQALSQCEETVVWVGVPQETAAHVLQCGFEGTGRDSVTVYHDPAAAHTAYLSTLALPPLIPTAIPPSLSSTLVPQIEPPALLPPMAAYGHLLLNSGYMPVGFEYPDVTLLGCLLLWSPDSQMVVQDLEAGKVQVPSSGFVLLRPKYSVTYSSIAPTQDSNEEQQKFGYSEWVLLNGNLTLDHVRSQFKVELQSEEQSSSTT